MANWLQKGIEKFDSWYSAVSGLGGPKDARWVPDCGVPLNPEVAMSLYHQNDLARLLSEVPVDFGTRNGWCIEGLDDEMSRLSIKSKLADAAAFGRACGGAALFLTINDGQDPANPVGEAAKGLSNVMVLDRRSMSVKTRNQDTRSARYGEPELYDITPPQGIGSVQQAVHTSRLVLLGGDRTAPRERVANGDWDYSVLDRAYPILQMYGLSWESASQLLNTMSQAVYGVQDLSNILTSEKGEETLLRRMSMIQRGRSTARAMVRDAENETFEILNTSLGGLPELMDRFAVRLAAAYRIPVTVLFGQAPAGLNATGASDLQIFWSMVRSWQQDTLYPALYRIAKILAPEREPEITIEDPDPLWKERQAELWLKRGQTDAIYVNSEVYTAAEVTKERQDYIKVSPMARDLLSESDSPTVDDASTPQDESKVQDTALNGAQISSMIEVVTAVGTGQIPRDAGKAIMMRAFQVDDAEAEALLGSIKEGENAPDPTADTGSADRAAGAGVGQAPAAGPSRAAADAES